MDPIVSWARNHRPRQGATRNIVAGANLAGAGAGAGGAIGCPIMEGCTPTIFATLRDAGSARASKYTREPGALMHTARSSPGAQHGFERRSPGVRLELPQEEATWRRSVLGGNKKMFFESVGN